MNPIGVALVLAGLVALATVLGLAWKSSQGRVHHTNGRTVVRAADVPGVRRFARGATLLQFSTEVCAPCVVTRTVLGDVAGSRNGVAHIDLDVTHRPDLASRFHVMQTPTTLILDRRGVVQARIGGAPRRDALVAELDRILAA
jgi:thiol-disulfide isomerase/thioredoxin